MDHYSYCRKILKYHFLPDKSKFTAATALGVNPFFVEGYAKAASNYNTGKLRHVFAYLKECDLKTKGVDNSGTPNAEPGPRRVSRTGPLRQRQSLHALDRTELSVAVAARASRERAVGRAASEPRGCR